MAIVTDLATGLGVLPVAALPGLSDRWRGIASAFTGGMMLSASVFGLVAKGVGQGAAAGVALGMLVGTACFAWVANRVKSQQWQMEGLGVADSRQAILIVATMSIQSIPEGLAVGVGYATGEMGYGLLLALAIAIHNVPEGVAVTLPLRAKGVPLWRCSAYAILTSLPQPLLAVPSFLFFSTLKPWMPFGLGFASGAMMFLVWMELLPDSLERCSREDCAWGTMTGLVLMFLVMAMMDL